MVSKLIDTSTCIGCKACEVACQEWNDLHIVPTTQTGTYQTMPSLDANYWNLIEFNEVQSAGKLLWLLRKDGCMHCADPGCLKACPAPGAIVQYQNGIVDVNPEACIGCKMCETGCPFDVPRYSAKTVLPASLVASVAEDLRTAIAERLAPHYKNVTSTFKTLEDGTEMMTLDGRQVGTATFAIVVQLYVVDDKPAPPVRKKK